MAVSFDAVGTGIPNASYGLTAQSCTLAPSTAANLLVLMWISFLHTAANKTLAGMVLAATYGASNQPMIEAARQGNSTATSPSGGVALFYLLNPNDKGAQTANVTCTADATTAQDDWWANAVSYLGAGGIGTPVLHGSTGSSQTVGPVTSAVGDMVAALIGSKIIPVTAVGGTARYTQSGSAGFESGTIQDAAGAASVTMTQSASSSTTYGGIAVDIQAAVSVPHSHHYDQAVSQAAFY